MAAHSIIGPSGAYRWMRCPGSVQRCKGLPNISSPFAAEGTAAHALGELALVDGCSPVGYLGEEVEGFVVDVEMAEAVGVYVDYVRDQIPGEYRLIEHRAEYPPEPELFGTADYVALFEQAARLYVADLKYGRGVQVFAENNYQLMIYALMTLLTLPLDRQRQIEEVEVVIIQPRLSHIDSWSITKDRLLQWSKDVLDPAITRALDPHYTELSAGEHCRFCLAKPTCPEIRKRMMEKVKIQFGAKPPAVEELAESDIVEALNFADELIDFAKSLKQWAHSRLERGDPVPGWKLVAKRATRQWGAEEGDITSRIFGASEWGYDDVYDMKLKSPAQVEKLLGKKLMSELGLTELVKAESTGFTMVREADKRPAVDPQKASIDQAKAAFSRP